MTATDALGDIHDNFIDMMAMVNSGNNPISSIQEGQPVPGISGAEYRDSNNNKSDKAALDYEIRITGKGKKNEDWAIQATKDNKTEFDWYDGKLLVDAKHYTEKSPVHPSKFDKEKPFFQEIIKESFVLKSARRQIDAVRNSNASGVQWRVVNEESARKIREILEEKDLLFIPGTHSAAERKFLIGVVYRP